ncbi:MAG: hypothetical protein U1A78_39020 [Polyangia bacterium]
MSLVKHIVSQRREVAEKTYLFLRRHGVRAAARRAVEVILQQQQQQQQAVVQAPASSAADLVKGAFPRLVPLCAYATPRKRPRINLITDSINTGFLYGGVGTASIFAALLAERLGCELRIITRLARADERNFKHIATLAKIPDLGNVSFTLCAETTNQAGFDVGEQELYITTSWWTTWSTVQTLGPSRVVYILQEDERMFYPYGDEHLRCTQTLSRPDLFYLINTKRLFEHLSGGDFPNVAARGTWFEPAFPSDLFFQQEPPRAGGKRKLLFYARPLNARNLFHLGIEALEHAIAAGVIDPNRWELHLVGRDIPSLRFSRPIQIERHMNLPWREYAALVRSMDLGLSLMYTPHPSYPPLDLAASGAVVVTNRFGSKQDLDEYSKNILCVEPTVDDLVHGLAQGVRLAEDREARARNFRENGLHRDWRASFASSIDEVQSRFF